MNTAKLDTFNGDSLDDLLGERSTSVRPAVQPPASYKLQDFSEPCRSCRGTGTFISYSGRPVGRCFKCKGKGQLTFKTSPDARAASRASAEARKARNEADAIDAFKTEYPDVWAWMDGSTFDFAVSLRAKLVKYGGLTSGQIEAARKIIAKRDAVRAERQAIVATAPVVDLGKLEAAFNQAKANGLKRIVVRFAGVKFSEASAASANAGALYVKRGEQYLGKIKSGRFMRSRECDAATEASVLAICADPKAAAIAYGKETGSCSCCGRELTDPVSIENGIGPICAGKFGW